MTWDDLPDVTPEGQALIRAHIHQVTREANRRAELPEWYLKERDEHPSRLIA